jgi:hypothetical protein
MNIPLNFKDITDTIISGPPTEDYEFKIACCDFVDGSIWIFPVKRGGSYWDVNDELFRKCIYISIDWSKKQYNVLTSVLGEGLNFTESMTAGILTRGSYKTKPDFLSFLTNIIINYGHRLKR